MGDTPIPPIHSLILERLDDLVNLVVIGKFVIVSFALFSLYFISKQKEKNLLHLTILLITGWATSWMYHDGVYGLTDKLPYNTDFLQKISSNEQGSIIINDVELPRKQIQFYFDVVPGNRTIVEHFHGGKIEVHLRPFRVDVGDGSYK